MHAINNKVKLCKLQLLQMVKRNGLKAKKLPADISCCVAGRHLETRTNHDYVQGLHD